MSSIIPPFNSTSSTKSIFDIDDKDLAVDSDNDDDILQLLDSQAKSNSDSNQKIRSVNKKAEDNSSDEDIFKIPLSKPNVSENVKGIGMTNTSLNDLFDTLDDEDEEDEFIKTQSQIFTISTQNNTSKKEIPDFPLIIEEKNEASNEVRAYLQ